MHVNRKAFPKLTASQINIILNIKSPCLTKEIMETHLLEWGITWHGFKRRARKSGLKTIFAYSWEEYQNNKLLQSKYNKNNLYIKCPCGKDYICLVFGFYNRKYNEPVCDICYRKQYAYDTQWRENNRKVQLIAQNKPETILKQIVSQKKRHAQPGMKEKYIKIGKQLWESGEYRAKVIKNSSTAMSGVYKKIEYQSSYELAFIMLNLENKINIKRFDLEGIEYFFNGKNHKYFPDFIINQNEIIEIKGKGGLYERNKVLYETKHNALIEWCKINGFYGKMLFDTDLPKAFIKKAKQWHKENQIGQIS